MLSHYFLTGVSTLLIASLSGCISSSEVAVTNSSMSSPHLPLFASEEDALTAAKNTYTHFLTTTMEILKNGEFDPEPLKTIATGQALEAELRSLTENREKGLRETGEIAFENVQLQHADLTIDTNSLKADVVAFYACVDVSKTDSFGSNGVSVLDFSNRRNRIPSEVHFDSNQGKLLVSSNKVWMEKSICD